MALAIDAAFHAEKNMLTQPMVVFPFSKSCVAHFQHRIITTVFKIIQALIIDLTLK
jgi:hypothetical protein